MLAACAVVTAGIGPYVGTADAQPISYEYTGGAETLVVDTSALDTGTDFTVEYSTQEGPGSPTVLARETYNTANLYGDELWFYNGGAYDTVNVTVSGYSGGEPAFETRGVATSLNLKKTVVGSTGGDSDTQCDTAEKLSSLTAQYKQLDCTAQPGSTTVNTTGTDSEQVETDIYQSGQNSKAQADNYHTTLDNYLSDTKTQARIIGKNAYIRALNNGSSKSAAKNEAKDAVSDYYAVKQQNLANEWDRSLLHYEYMRDTARSETGITQSASGDLDSSSDFVNYTVSNTAGGATYVEVNSMAEDESLSLVNGSTVSVKGIDYVWSDPGAGNTGASSSEATASPVAIEQATESSITAQLEDIGIKAPGSNEDYLVYHDLHRYSSAWSEIESQNTQVQNDMDTLAENTYSAYQQGEINSSDLVDPYVLANERSAGDNFDTWSAAQLTMLGQNTPSNMDSAGEFEIETESGETVEGILTSRAGPSGGAFETGQTYDTAALEGSQFVITEDRIRELNGNFTIKNITSNNGENVQNVTIEKTTYETTNVTELKQQYEELAEFRAELEAREQALNGGGGGAGGGFLSGSSDRELGIIALGGAALVYLLGRN